MSDESDRVAMVSDLTAARTELTERIDSLEQRLGDTLGKRLSETSDKLEKRLSETEETMRRHLDVVLENRLSETSDRLEKRLSETEETMRRHFNMVAERVESSVKLVAEVNAHHASILSNHETRLQKIEQRS